MTDPRLVPVIVGIGESIDRECRHDPRSLAVEAVRSAASEARTLLGRVQSIDVVSVLSWRYADLGHLIARDLGVSPVHARESDVGGEKPIRLLAEAAARIARGEQQVALICGAEATRTRAQAARSGRVLDWGPTDMQAKAIDALHFVTPHAARYGLLQPIQVYPLYENAARHAWRQSALEALRESAALWSRHSDVAARNPTAWLAKHHDATQIIDESAENRLLAYPYRKLMVANPSVNQGAAILVSSLAAARDAGIPRERLVYVWSGALANEPTDFLARDRYDRSAVQDLVLAATLERNATPAAEIDLWELYSCFPAVPKMARRTLGLSDNACLSLAGGLTFFGAPANNYMTHAIAAAVRAIRTGAGEKALLYGQGEFVTKHAAIILGNREPERKLELHNVQRLADAAMGAVPPLREDYEGGGAIETYTIIYDRTGKPDFAPVICRTPTGERVLARAPASDTEVIRVLSNQDREPIGIVGRITQEIGGTLRFHLTE